METLSKGMGSTVTTFSSPLMKLIENCQVEHLFSILHESL